MLTQPKNLPHPQKALPLNTLGESLNKKNEREVIEDENHN